MTNPKRVRIKPRCPTRDPVSSRTIATMLLLASWAIACFGQDAGRSCLSYDPSVVQLTGTLVRKTFPGPPEYKSVRGGDRPETSWFLNLLVPVCVDQDAEQPDLSPAHKDVRTIQLVVSADFYKKYKYLVGRRVVVSGTLFGEFTGHHHTPVLLTVSTLAKAEQRVR